MTMLVRPDRASSSAAWTAASDSESRCAVASSRIDDVGRLEQHARDREALPLAAGQPVAAVADDGVDAVGQARDEVRDVRLPQRALDVGVRGLRAGVAQVLRDRVVEEVGLLADDADRRAQRGLRDVAQVGAGDPHGARASGRTCA